MFSDEIREMCENNFEHHKANLIQNTDRYFIVDWRDENGSNINYVNYIIDKSTGTIIITGDLGDCVATWFNALEPEQIRNFIRNDISYFISKIQCTSDKYTWNNDDIFEDIMDKLKSLNDDDDFNDFFDDNNLGIDDMDDLEYEIKNAIGCSAITPEFHPSNQLYDIISEFDTDCIEWLSYCGQKIDNRLYMWAYGFDKAMCQLGF